MRGNQPLQHRTSHKMVFFGKPFPISGEKKNDRHDVNMAVTYMPKTSDQILFENLANAYEHFLVDSYEEMILPSAVALEYAIEWATVKVLKEVKLPANLSHSKRLSLEVIIPLICRLHGIPLLDRRIMGPVVKLWGLRNEMAHEGGLKNSLELGDAAQLLAAAMFCLNYLVYFRDSVNMNMGIDA